MRLFILLVALPTVIFIVIASRFGFVLPRLNLDLLVLYVVTVLIGRWSRRPAIIFATAGTTFVLAMQVLFGLGAIYIEDAALLREYFEFASLWPWRLIGFWLLISAVAIAALHFLMRQTDPGRAKLWPILVVFGLLIVLDVVARAPAGHDLVGSNPVTSSSWRARKMIQSLIVSPGFKATPRGDQLLRDVVMQDLARPGTILSISVEALGLAHDPRINEAIMSPLRASLRGRYKIIVEHHVGKGATIAGELRELCNATTSGTPTASNAKTLRPSCLPAWLQQQGYKTLAIHGNSGLFFNRLQLYPALGFDKTLFLTDFAAVNRSLKLCRTLAFEGVCDRDALQAALAHLSGPGKRFAHVMTLDTHFPLGTLTSGENCSRVPGLADKPLCVYVGKFAQMMSMIGRDLAAMPDPPERVYIFGDHPPPYAIARERMAFDRGRVPFITLVRDDGLSAR